MLPGRKTLFVADLHLAEERPQASTCFFQLLDSLAGETDALYILGDLFEYWVGDDDLASPLALETARNIRKLSTSGIPVYFMHGNRDFLLAERYASIAGMTLLEDPAVIDLYGTRTLLTHGDGLCTDDVGFQRFRRVTRNPLTRKLLLALPLRLRHALARSARGQSERSKSGKAYEIMDVNQEAVELMFRHYRAERMVHGHTHRPAHHSHTTEGIVMERWVLPDWYGPGGYLSCTPEGCELLPLACSSMTGSSNLK